ncbi:hypothetical protein EXE46_15795 [Halorubrum sp. GN11_10-6_MGM]|uniref:hypothetical protein n=1 Tax=Halorubrum sp. GN11_10-6_MGM TaxID=2518112 RepID=UPI0010FA2F7E|nr:hypothetical protein [Halorubrum sp. GN11_10-6_MGM]TKX72481.1 hypothetical protein EXE46_15795 [Halorubrum sp. GN11_10-6_MGM]
MADSSDRGGGPPIDSDAFQEWVTHTAETRDVDEQELLNQLISAFWILDEMNGVTEGGDPIGSGKSLYPPEPADPGQQLIDDSEVDSDIAAERSRSGEETERDDGKHGTGSGDRAAADRSPDDTEAGASSEGAQTESAADELRSLRESMYEQLEMIQTVVELRRQVSDLSLDVEQQRSRQEEFADRFSDNLTRLHSRVEALDNRLDETDSVDETELDRISEEFSVEIDRLESTQREFEAWIDEEFDEIEALFRRLVDTTDTLEDRIDTLDAELSTLRDDDAAADRLASLRRDALSLGTDTGRCEHCETTIDLSMLDEPNCPDCDATFVAAEPAESWSPFAKPILRTSGHVK